MIDDFWMVDRDFGLLGINIVPGLLVPRANRARTRFFRAFRQYYASGGPEHASRFIRARYEVNKKYGVPDEEIAQFDLGVCTALLVNTVPAMAWILYHAFSSPAILAQLRAGIEDVVFGKDAIGSSSTTPVNIPEIIKGFPFLEAFVIEVLRTQSHGPATRRVLQDTLIEDTDGTPYLLKKDSILVMPSHLVHENTAGWGANAGKFDPTRFLGAPSIKMAASSYRVFGGGNAICPGKQFAMNSMMSVLLIMVLRFDLEPLNGTWEKPVPKEHIATSFLMPTEDIRVKMKPRKLDTSFEFVWEST